MVCAISFNRTRHIIEGYKYLSEKGYLEAARICLTHAFPHKDIQGIFLLEDCDVSEYDFVNNFINNAQYSLYDKLIQLCDNLAQPFG